MRYTFHILIKIIDIGGSLIDTQTYKWYGWNIPDWTSIREGQCMIDFYNKYVLALRTDGNLVVRNGATIVWQTNTNHVSNTNPYHLEWNSAGVFLKDTIGVTIWSRLVDVPAGNGVLLGLAFYHSDGHVEYVSNTNSVLTTLIANIFT